MFCVFYVNSCVQCAVVAGLAAPGRAFSRIEGPSSRLADPHDADDVSNEIESSNSANSHMVPTLQHSAANDSLAGSQRAGGTHVRSSSMRSALYRCVAANGVAYRRSSNLVDKIMDRPGPYYGNLVVVTRKVASPSGAPWVQAANGLWLPVAINGEAKFEFVKFL